MFAKHVLPPRGDAPKLLGSRGAAALEAAKGQPQGARAGPAQRAQSPAGRKPARPSVRGASQAAPRQEDHPVLALLAEMNMLQYAQAFFESGFDDLDTLLEMEEADMKDLGLKSGHVIKLRRRVRELAGAEEPKAAAPKMPPQAISKESSPRPLPQPAVGSKEVSPRPPPQAPPPPPQPTLADFLTANASQHMGKEAMAWYEKMRADLMKANHDGSMSESSRAAKAVPLGEVTVFKDGKALELPKAPPPTRDPDWMLLPAGQSISAVQASWERVKAVGSDAVGGMIYRHFSDIEPEAIKFKLFNFGKALSSVGICIGQLYDKENLVPKIQQSGMRHAGYVGVTEAQFPALGRAMMLTLRDILGPDFTHEVAEAWMEEYNFISYHTILGMKDAWAITSKAQRAVADATERQVSSASSVTSSQHKATGQRMSWRKSGIPAEEVAKHSHADSAWIVIKDRVYDCTSFLDQHPGGRSMLLALAGQDATREFETVHSDTAWDMLGAFYVGPLLKEAAAPPPSPMLQAPAAAALEAPAVGAAPAAAASQRGEDAFLLPLETQRLPLMEKIAVTHDTHVFRFALPPGMRLGLPIGQHLLIKANCDGRTVTRPYTPITDDGTLGFVDLMVKVYFAGVHPDFPEGGKMSQHLDSMQFGESVEVRGPFGNFVYLGRGEFTWKGEPRKCTHLSLIAGGTGITLVYQVAQAILRDPEDATQVKLLFANQTPDDILGKWLLDDLVAEHPDRFEVWYTVDRVPEGVEWHYDVSYVNDAMIRQNLFEPDEDVACLLCGPPAMCEKACVPNLLKVGYLPGNIFTG